MGPQAETLSAPAALAIDAPVADRDGRRRVVVDGIAPRVDDGAFEVKRTLGDRVRVEADVFTDGHDVVACSLLWRPRGERGWREQRMQSLGNDRFAAELVVDRLGPWELAVEGWIDSFGG